MGDPDQPQPLKQYLLKLLQQTRRDRQPRFLRRKRKLSRVKAPRHEEKLQTDRRFESSDSCLGDSEKSDSDSDERSEGEPEVKVSRKQCAKTRHSLAEDQLENNRKGELVCLTCLKKFSNIQNLRRHLRLHLQRDSNIAELDSDGETVEESKKRFLCDFCPEKFDNKSAFQVHEKLHSSAELVCYVCEKKYLDRYSLRYHLRTHGIGLQIRCELCGKNFTKQSRLQSHIDSIHKDIRKFSCPHCDKAFKAKPHLDNHLLQHTGGRPWHCKECGDSFRHKLSLVSHMRTHSDCRPYVCDTCGKSFRDNSTLKAHSRVHSGEKPYKCDLCSKTFTQRAGLNYHRAAHTGLKPHKCSQCDYAAAKKASLVSHVKARHKIIEIQCGHQEEEQGVSTPALPSPPTQQGDAVYPAQTGTQEPHSSGGAEPENKYEEQLSALSALSALPSFNILKSYDSSSLQDSIVRDQQSGGSESGRYSPPDSHSPSLSPPLTPVEEYQDTIHPYSYQSQSFAPLNYSTSSECDQRYHNYYPAHYNYHTKREMYHSTTTTTTTTRGYTRDGVPVQSYLHNY